MADEIRERIALIALHSGNDNASGNKVLVFGSVQRDEFPDTWKYDGDQRRKEQLQRIAWHKELNTENELWELWLGRVIEISQLQDFLVAAPNERPLLLWNDIFLDDPFTTDYSVLSDYIAFHDVLRPDDSLVKDDHEQLVDHERKVGPREINIYPLQDRDETERLRYFSGLGRLLYLQPPDDEGRHYRAILDAVTANSNALDKKSSRLIFLPYQLEVDSTQKVTPFIQYVHIRSYVRLLLNSHWRTSIDQHDASDPAGIIWASRVGANNGTSARTLFDPYNYVQGAEEKNLTMGFDAVRLGTTTAAQGDMRKIRKYNDVFRCKGYHVTFPKLAGPCVKWPKSLQISTGESCFVGHTKFFDTSHFFPGNASPIGDRGHAAQTPGFSALGLTVSSGHYRMANRGFGFRQIGNMDCSDPEIPPLILRFESACFLDDPLPGAFTARFNRRSYPGLLAQEQYEKRQIEANQDWGQIPKQVTWQVSLTSFNQDLTPYGAVSDDVSAGTFISNWNEMVVKPVLDSLHRIKDGQNLSTLPQLTLSGSSRLNWGLFGYLADLNPGVREMPWGTDSSEARGQFLMMAPVNASLGLAIYSRSSAYDFPELKCTFKAFRDVEGSGVVRRGKFTSVTRLLPTDTNSANPLDGMSGQHFQAGYDTPGRDSAPAVRVQILPMDNDASSDVRIGAFAFQIANEVPTSEDDDALLDAVFVQGNHREPTTTIVPQLEWCARFPVLTVEQQAEDLPERTRERLANARRVEPLVAPANQDREGLIIPLERLRIDQNRFFVLTAEERISEFWSHSFTLDLQVREVKDPPAPLTIRSTVREEGWNIGNPGQIYFNRTPFVVAAAMHIDFFENFQQGSDPRVAVYTIEEDSGRWEVKNPGQRLAIYFPPQAVGESMEKERDEDRLAASFDFKDGERADFRLSPVTRMEIDTSQLDTEFGEPALNIQRLFGHAAGSRSGAGLYSASFELLYGMAAQLAPDQPRREEAPLRIAERAALDGRPPPALGTGLNATYFEHWDRMRTSLASRLGVFDISTPFSPQASRLTDGVNFRLRANADLKHPVKGYQPDPVLDRDLPFQDEGLAGGVSFAFESANIVRAVWREPNSNTGLLDKVRISARGGYGQQRGTFDDEKTAIETVTAMGRVHRYKLERVGRIACLWHRAKHVIVYERTVVPSPQFVNANPIGRTQDQHTGRPVLRKIEEYVEILEPTRRFDADADEQKSFCLRGAVFRSLKIRVDSRWGRDVRRKQGGIIYEGWEVPLWQAELGEVDLAGGDPEIPFPVSTIYPKPQVDGIFIDGEGAEICVEIFEPEKLRFYTSTNDNDGKDTDIWPTIAGVDFPLTPEPKIPDSNQHPLPMCEGELPSPVRIPPGWERFTLELEEGGEHIAICHQRVKDQGPTSRLQNITIARSIAGPGGDEGIGEYSNLVVEAVGGADLALDQIAAIVQNLNPGRIDDAAMNLEQELARRIQEFKDKKNKIKGVLDGAVNAATGAAGKISELLGDDVCVHVTNEISRAINQGTTRLKNEALQAGAAITAQLREQIDQFDVFFEISVTELEEFRSLAFARLNGAQSGLRRQKDEILIRLEGIVQPSLGQVAELSQASVPIRQVRLVLEDVKADLEALRDSGSGTFPGEADDIAALLNKIEPKIIKIRRKISRHVQRYPQLSVVDAVLIKSQGYIRKIRNALRDAGNSFRTLTEALYEQINDVLTGATDALSVAEQALGIASGAVTSLNTKIHQERIKLVNFVQDHYDGLETLIDSAKTEIEEIEPTGSVNEIRASITSLRDEVGRLLNEFNRQLNDKIREITASINGILQDRLADTAQKICDNIYGTLTRGGALTSLGDELDRVVSGVDTFIAKLEDKFGNSKEVLESTWRNVSKTVDDIRRDVETKRQAALATFEGVRERVADFKEEVDEIHQQGSRTLRLIRAIGDPPDAAGLDINRREVAFVIDAAKDLGLDMTPAIARVNRALATAQAVENAALAVEDTLESFGIGLPIREMTEQFKPDNALKDFDISRILPDMGGLKLGGLFKDLKFPDLGDDLKDKVKIKHRFDRETRSAIVDATVKVPLEKRTEILALGPVKLDLHNGRFDAEAQLVAQLDGQTTQSSKGAMTGDFALDVAGIKLLRFRDTSLTFDDRGNTEFNISPDKVELDAALEFIMRILRKVTADTGFVVEPVENGGQPVGLAAVLDMELPNLAAGAFAITGLKFYTAFEIIIRPGFEIGVKLALGKRLKPFALTVAFLTGGGYVISNTRYRPSTGFMTQELAISANAGAGASFSFGVIEGHVSLLVGIEVAFYWRNGGKQSLSIALYVLGTGGITVLGILKVDLALRLEVRYVNDGIVASGTLTFTVRLSIFAKVKVRERAEYQLTGSPAESNDGGYGEAYG